MKNPRNIVFTVIVSLFLCCTLAQQAYSFATGQGSTERQSTLEGRTLQAFPALSLESLETGEFQDQFEQYAADSLPVRDQALKANASAQQIPIGAASALFNIGVRPTFYDSSYLYESDENALVHAPHLRSGKGVETCRKFARHLKKAARSHPEKRFVVLVVAQSDYSVSNEASKNYDSAQLLTAEDVAGIFQDNVGKLDNVTVIACDYDTPEEYFRHFFRTDNHWNIRGTSDAYNAAARKLGLSPFLSSNDQTFSELKFSGAWARSGLFPLSETPFAEGNDFSKMIVHENDGSTHDASWQTRLSRVKVNRDNTVDDFYVDFYGAKTSAWIKGLGPASQKALLIGDSYAASFKYLLATQYGKVTTNWSLHRDYSGEDSLEDILETSGAEDVFMVAEPDSYRTLAKRYPSYWN